MLDNLLWRIRGDPLAKARRLRERNQPGRAVEFLQNYLRIHPDHLPSRLLLAAIQMEEGRLEDAADALLHAFQTDPHAGQEIYLLVDRFRIPRENLWPIHVAEAESQIRQGELSEALRRIEGIPREVRTRLRDQRLSQIREVIQGGDAKKIPHSRLVSGYFAALTQESLGAAKEAAELYQTLISRNPGEIQRIVRRFEALLATEYRNIELRVSLGEMYLEMDRVEQAIQEFSLALELDPSCAPALADRLQALLDGGKEQEGLHWILIQARSSRGIGREVLERIRRLADKGHYIQDSIQLLERKLKDHFDPEAALLIAHMYLLHGRASEALEWISLAGDRADEEHLARAYEEVIQERPDAAQAYLLLTDICLRRGNTRRAMDLLRTLQEVDPSQDSLVLSKLSRLVERDPSQVGAQKILAEILLRKGAVEKATILLRHSLRKSPGGDPDTRRMLEEALQDRPEDPHLRLGLAEAWTAEKRFQDALKEISLLAGKAPHLTAEFLHLLSFLSLQTRELATEAVKILQDLLRSDTLPDAVHFATAQAEASAGNISAAVKRYREIFRKWPGRLDAVAQALHHLAETSPSSPEVRYALAEIALARGEYERASQELRLAGVQNRAEFNRILESYLQAVSRDPKNIVIRLGLSSAYLVGRYFQRVLSLGQETLSFADNETTAPLRLDMGDAHRELGDFPSAVKMYFSAFQARRDLAPRVLECLEGLLRIDPGESLAHLARGRVLLHLERVQEGMDALLEAWRQDPNRSNVVLRHLEQLCSLNPTVPFIPLAMATILRGTGKAGKAIHVLGELLDCSPQVIPRVIDELLRILKEDDRQALGWFHLGRGYQARGEVSRASGAYLNAYRADEKLAPRVRNSLRQMAKDHPGYPEVCASLGRILAAEGKNLEAAEWLQKAILKSKGGAGPYLEELESLAKNEPSNSQIAFILGTEYVREKRFGPALSCYEKVLDLQPSLHREVRICASSILEAGPKIPEGLLVRCRAWFLEGRFQEALADLQEASRCGAPAEEVLDLAQVLHEKFPRCMNVLIFLLDLLIASGSWEKACQVLEKTSFQEAKTGEKIALLLRMWRILHAQGNEEKALAVLREAEALAPDKNSFLERIHAFRIHHMKQGARSLEEEILQSGDGIKELPALIERLVDLGDCPRAQKLLRENRDRLEPDTYFRLAASAYDRQGLHYRALDSLKAGNPTRETARSAEKCGELPLAAAVMEKILENQDDPALEKRLERCYIAMALRDLERGSDKLVGETVIRYSN